MELLSGGQKSRVALAKVCRDEPHLLLLDEPTNHLDIESVEGLAKALCRFQGAVVMVSHDERLLSTACNELWHVDGQGSVKQLLDTTFAEYKRRLLAQFPCAAAKASKKQTER